MQTEDALSYLDLVLEFLDPVLRATEDSGQAFALLMDLGYLPPSEVDAFSAFSGVVSDLVSLIDTIDQALDSGDAAQIDQSLLPILEKVGSIFEVVNTIGTKIRDNFAGTTFVQNTDIVASIVQKIADYLVIKFFEDNHQTLFAGLLIAGIFDIDDVSDTPTQFNVAYRKRTVNWDRIPKFFSDPIGTLKNNFISGDELLYSRCLFCLDQLGTALGLRSGYATPEYDVLTTLNQGTDLSTRDDYDAQSILQFPLVTDSAGGLALDFYPLRDGATGKYTGIGAGLHLSGQLQIPISDAFEIDVKFTSNLNDSLGLRLDKDGNFSFINKLFTPNPETLASAIQFNVTVSLVPTATGPQSPLLSIGVPQGSRLLIGSGALTLGFENQDSFRLYLEGYLKNVQLNFATGEADSFLSSLLPKGGTPTNFDFGVGFSNQRGLYFKGASNLKIRVPLQLTLGPINLQYLQIELAPKDNSFPLTLSTGFSATIGPIAAVVDEVGVRATFETKADRTGNFGPLDVGFGFKFPSGLGLSLDAGAVSGGGFVSFDQEKGEYAGFLDISIVDIIQVKFICILDTKLPDGSKGFSLLFIIFMELPPIQLGFGFTLNGVGGLAGIHRTMSPSGLQTGIHNHTLDYLINPPHTIADAPKAITAINSFFPAAQGRYLFGPILELGWETFIEVTVGVILEVPDPIKLAILGILDIALPTIEEPEEALVKIHIDVLGIIDFGTMKLSVDGSMYDSSLLEFPLLGDFALRTSWGTNPSSAFSLGGFNPNFNATGLDMPQLHRLSITISDGDNPVISANAYLALTSNTRQFGANIEASVRAGSFSVHGYLGFDLLVTVQRHAISFEFDFAAILDVSYKGHSLAGINVTGQLTGPTPWHIHGDASFHILCFSVSKSVDHTWGQNILATIVAMAILPDLLPPFLDPQNRNAALPDGATQAVTLSAPAANKSAILVHPMGALTVREKVVPLDLTIDQYKNGTPADGNYFSMGDVLINGSKVSKGAHHQDYFAAGEFLNLSDADKLSRSSFELYHAGMRISSTDVASGANASRTVEYQELYVEDPVLPPRPPVTYTMPADVFEVLSRQSAGFSSRLKNTGLSKYKAGPSTPAATTGDPAYVVASADDLSVRTDIIGSSGTSYYQVRDALNSHLAKNPQDAGKLQILPAHEVAP